MADESQQRTVNTAFAPPPPLWKHFTRENIDKVEQIKVEASRGEDGRLNKNKKWSPAELRALEIPSELRYLVPPDIPEGQYSVFGELQTVCSPLHLSFAPDNTDSGIALYSIAIIARAGN
jgi:mediator of RNA polymerase II transcription subunit 7